MHVFELLRLLFLALLVASVVLPLWMAVDAAVRPEAAYRATGQNKIVWVLVSLFTCLVARWSTSPSSARSCAPPRAPRPPDISTEGPPLPSRRGPFACPSLRCKNGPHPKISRTRYPR